MNCEIYINRSQNELNLSRIIMHISIKPNIQTQIFKIEKEGTLVQLLHILIIQYFMLLKHI